MVKTLYYTYIQSCCHHGPFIAFPHCRPPTHQPTPMASPRQGHFRAEVAAPQICLPPQPPWIFMTPAGLKPAIPGSVGRCLIHWATVPLGLACATDHITVPIYCRHRSILTDDQQVGVESTYTPVEAHGRTLHRILTRPHTQAHSSHQQIIGGPPGRCAVTTAGSRMPIN